MDEGIISELEDVLSSGKATASFLVSELPEQLLENGYIHSEFRPPVVCPAFENCREHVNIKISKDRCRIICEANHEQEYDMSDFTYYDVSYSDILESIVEFLGLESLEIIEYAMPRYMSATTEEGINVFLIISPSNYESTINDICMQTLRKENPAVIITPHKTIENLLEIQSLFSTGNMIYALPLTMILELEEITRSIETILAIQELEAELLENHLSDAHPAVYRVNSNPRYIMTELNHLRLLRMNQELPQSSGARLEGIGESAFSHLFAAQVNRGGEVQRGSNLPDSIFYIPQNSLPSGYDPVLGIVDSKSGKDANFASESVEGKHDEYLKRGRRQALAADFIAHTFLVLGFDGHQEIDFFDRMEPHYEQNECCVVMTAEALGMIMSAYLAHTVANELTLRDGSFQSTIYPFFHKDRFREANLKPITREVGRDQSTYDEKYKQRERLLVITEDVVLYRIRDCLESHLEIEEILETYYRPLPLA